MIAPPHAANGGCPAQVLSRTSLDRALRAHATAVKRTGHFGFFAGRRMRRTGQEPAKAGSGWQ